MKYLLIFSFIFGLTFKSSFSLAENKPSKKMNANIYEQDTSAKSFTAKVRVVREITGETEVFFESESAKGTYYLPSSVKDFNLLKNRLRKSLKSEGPRVKVTADDENKILSVEIDEGPDQN